MRSGISPIPQYSVVKLEKNRYIPNTAAQLPQNVDPEAKPFLISFKHYRDDLCQIENLVKNGARRALKNIRSIGKCYDRASLHEQNIDILPVGKPGAYATLYNGLSPDIEILEHKIQSTARLFYFIAGNHFFIRAITNTHFETGKHY